MSPAKNHQWAKRNSSGSSSGSLVKDHLWGFVRLNSIYAGRIPFVIFVLYLKLPINFIYITVTSLFTLHDQAWACDKMISAAEYQMQSGLWDGSYFEKKNIYGYIAKMVWSWERFWIERCCTTSCFLPFLLMKSSRYKTTLKVFSQTTCYTKRRACWRCPRYSFHCSHSHA